MAAGGEARPKVHVNDVNRLVALDARRVVGEAANVSVLGCTCRSGSHRGRRSATSTGHRQTGDPPRTRSSTLSRNPMTGRKSTSASANRPIVTGVTCDKHPATRCPSLVVGLIGIEAPIGEICIAIGGSRPAWRCHGVGTSPFRRSGCAPSDGEAEPAFGMCARRGAVRTRRCRTPSLEQRLTPERSSRSGGVPVCAGRHGELSTERCGGKDGGSVSVYRWGANVDQ